MASDIAALRKWGGLHEETKNLLLENVFCVNCSVTTVVDYDISSQREGILIKGKCKQCGHDAARFVEDEWFGGDSE